jgi:hypothetical protein
MARADDLFKDLKENSKREKFESSSYTDPKNSRSDIGICRTEREHKMRVTGKIAGLRFWTLAHNFPGRLEHYRTDLMRRSLLISFDLF